MAGSVPEVVEDSAEELVTPVDESGKNVPPVSTPKSDITIIKTDATPKKNGILVNSTLHFVLKEQFVGGTVRTRAHTVDINQVES
jgi:hypothetical protein